MVEMIQVEVAYASQTQQKIIALKVASSDSLADIIHQSGMLELFPEIDLQQQRVGIFGKWKKLTDTASNGDRIEIYRPLLIDPKEARRLRARKKLS